MGLITYEQFEDDTFATANSLNERFGAFLREFNGNIDSDNLKDGSVTRAKIANGSINKDKLDMELYVDENGWTVSDLGGIKTYSRSLVSPALNLGEGIRGTLAVIKPPVGRTRDNIVIVTTWYGGYSGHVLLGCKNTGATDITVQVAHNWASPLVMSGTAHLIAQEKV